MPYLVPCFLMELVQAVPAFQSGIDSEALRFVQGSSWCAEVMAKPATEKT